jgi:uncharacterized protein
MRVVLDTNVLISAILVRASPSAQVITLWRGRKFDVLTAAQQIEEFSRATRYPQVRSRITPALAGALLNRVRDRAIVIENLPQLDVSPDPDDNYLLALAQAGQAPFLVTGDKELLALKQHAGTRIVTPAALLEFLQQPHPGEGAQK